MKRLFLALMLVGCARPQTVENPCTASCPVCATSPAPAKAATERPPGLDATKDELITLLNAGDGASIFALFAPEMKEAVPLADVTAYVISILEKRGIVLAATPLSVSDREGNYRLNAERGTWKLSLSVNAQGQITGLTIRPEEKEPPLVRSARKLGLPFRGSWLVFWGGDGAELNAHVGHGSQRRAADLVVVDPQGKTHRDQGTRNEDYYAYGQEVLASADGKVSAVLEGVHDNEPGSMNAYSVLGNAVIIEHAPDLYSVYAHLKPGSARVHAGSLVKAGQLIGQCGNSGNSSEPHLHFQLQDGPLFERSWGVEAVFDHVMLTRDGSTHGDDDYLFRKGDVVSPDTAAVSTSRRR